MQARFISLIAATAVVAAATFAFADEQNGPQGVQTQPAEAGFDFFLDIDGVKGESRDPPPPPPPPPPPQNAPAAEMGIIAPDMREAALLVPAVQKIREAAASAPQGDGVVVLDGTLPSGGASAPRAAEIAARSQGVMPELPICGHCGADTAIGSANGGIWKTTDGAAAETSRDVTTGGAGLMPELPICAHCSSDARRTGATESAPRDPEQPVCGHCGADVAAAPVAATTEERPRRRVFSLSIGGITVGSDGSVNVAVGDVTGDGQDDEGGERPVRARSSQRR
ncbi:hypothetical protein [Terricaulis silvestris]|uniref:Uncharacterized protein n=1 Tax=Terricaulis silvestris TaxID=2686094 RepID=A0A6I6MUH7_9CAUL|nr:hypothetical protein [Terricaulis silvestris]QGZ96407.1 hypothetical protein DSM104635_03266 [Terricaulis silvestris]